MLYVRTYVLYRSPRALPCSILEYVCDETTLSVSGGSSDHPSKVAVGQEKQLMEKFKVRVGREGGR